MKEQRSLVGDSVIIRRANLNDIRAVINSYCSLSISVRRFFHPFPFNRNKVTVIFLVMWINGLLFPLFKRIRPKFAAKMVVAVDKETSTIAGFAFFNITKKENLKFVANAGPIIFEQFQGKGIGLRMYDLLIRYAKDAGISKFQVTIMESNSPSILFHEKIGYTRKGYVNDEFWDGKFEKNLEWELNIDPR